MRRPLFAVSFSLLVFGCASITGLSKDYDFSDDASVDGAVEAAGDSGSGGKNDAGACNADFSKFQNASQVSGPCRDCLEQHCCDEIRACAADTTCNSFASCEFNCVNQGNSRRDCLNQCRNTDKQAVALTACMGTNCNSLTNSSCANLFR